MTDNNNQKDGRLLRPTGPLNQLTIKYSKTYEIRTCKIRNFKEPDSLKKFRIVEKYPNYYIFGLNLNNRSIFGDTEA